MALSGGGLAEAGVVVAHSPVRGGGRSPSMLLQAEEVSMALTVLEAAGVAPGRGGGALVEGSACGIDGRGGRPAGRRREAAGGSAESRPRGAGRRRGVAQAGVWRVSCGGRGGVRGMGFRVC
jgi:hypothetical protein